MHLFLNAISSDSFWGNNEHPRRTSVVEKLLESEGICRMDWPVCSHDLNPIEHIWDALGRHIKARSYFLENTKQLKQIFLEEQQFLIQELLDNLAIEIIEVDRLVSSRSIAQELKIDHKTVLSHLSKVGFKKKLNVWVPHQITPRNTMDRISIYEALAKRKKSTHFLSGW
ncbi:transposable element Tc3 transposase [Trichonephila clavipes]|nr:transposable element Tc3 transposase [Trichonephila clavipes]